MSEVTKEVAEALRIAANKLDPQSSSQPVETPKPADPVVVPPVHTPADSWEGGLPTASVWLGGWLPSVWSYVDGIMKAAEAAKTIPLFTWYNIKDRDNGGYSSGGASGKQQYWDFVGAGVAAQAGRKCWNVLEPDALGLSRNMANKEERFEMLAGAAKAINQNPNAVLFADASTWVEDPNEMAELLNKVPGIDGFSLNWSNYYDNAKMMTYGDKVSKICGLPYIIDTSRNGAGNPHAPMWCNVTDTRIGSVPTLDTGNANCLAFVHGKIAGESDGKGINDDGSHPRTDVPDAGVFWPEYHKAITTGDWKEFKQKYKVA